MMVRRGNSSLALLKPYLMPGTGKYLEQFAAAPAAVGSLVEVNGVVIGSLRISSVCKADFFHSPGKSDDSSPAHFITVELDGNFTEKYQNGSIKKFYMQANLEFVRVAGIQSKAPNDIFVLACQSCGGTLNQETIGEACPYCSQPYHLPFFNWKLNSMEMAAKPVSRPSCQIQKGQVIESGYCQLLKKQYDLENALNALETEGGFSRDAFIARVEAIFDNLYTLWQKNDMEGMVPFLTDRLASSFQFWITTYQTNNMKNILEEWKIESIEPSTLREDRFYDAITVRVRASVIDYTIEGKSKIVDGSDCYRRFFAEYWTLVRSVVPPEKGTCPSCGVEILQDQSTRCSFCGSRLFVPRGEWRLSTIEQAETYKVGREGIIIVFTPGPKKEVTA
ncbi:TIM44-like domain-containing protein [Myxococcota bacterium]|nr:TIM44-like domain-containing protein [Myxococcota bacterium]